MDDQVITKGAVQQVLRDYREQYRRHWLWALVGFLLPAIGTIFIFFIPPLIVARIINLFIRQGTISIGAVGMYLAIFGSVWLFGEVLWRIGLHFLIKLEAKGFSQLGQLVFRRLSSRDYEFYTDNFVGSLTKKGLAFVRSFETFTDTLNFNIISDLVPMLFAAVVLWRYSPWIPIFLILAFTTVVAVTLPVIRRRSRLVAQRHDASSKVSGRLSDAVTNILAIKSFAKETEELASYGTYVDDFSRKFKRAADYHNQHFDVIVTPLQVATNLLGLMGAIYFTHRFGLPAGTIVVVFTYYSLLTRMFWEINRVYRNIESSISEAAEFTQLFLAQPKIQDAPEAKDLTVTTGAIGFHSINFSYLENVDHQTMFLKDLSLDIPAQQKVGLVGPSGGGKTTITKLLLRFVDTNSGSITIDGLEIKQVTQRSLRRSIGYVPQEPLLFHRTLRENIAYGHDQASMDDVIAAAKLARAHEFIELLPKGYETFVGERGIKLSSGQKQRVAIARAILKNAPILILDEATSALDSESEKYIQEGLLELLKNKTALVIAHRLSTIKHLDRIIVLDQGKVVQDGSHAELIKQEGIYANLWRHQSGGFLEEA